MQPTLHCAYILCHKDTSYYFSLIPSLPNINRWGYNIVRRLHLVQNILMII